MSIVQSLAILFELLTQAAESLTKAAQEIAALKKDLIAHPQIDGSASDAAAEEIDRHTATTVKVRVPQGDGQ